MTAMKLAIAAVYALFSGKPSAYARVAELKVQLNKDSIAETRQLLILKERYAVASATKSIDRLKERAESARQKDIEMDFWFELCTFDSVTDRRIAAIEERLAKLKSRRAALRADLVSKQADKKAAAERENAAINAALAGLAIELAELVSQKDADEGIAESV